MIRYSVLSLTRINHMSIIASSTHFPTTSPRNTFADTKTNHNMPPTEKAFLASLEELTCPICLEHFDSDSKHYPVSIDGCRHIFGATCLTQWAKSNCRKRNTCPTCRAVLFELPAPARRPDPLSPELLLAAVREQLRRDAEELLRAHRRMQWQMEQDQLRRTQAQLQRELEEHRRIQAQRTERVDQERQTELARTRRRKQAYKTLASDIVLGGGEEGLLYQFVSHIVLETAKAVEAETAVAEEHL